MITAKEVRKMVVNYLQENELAPDGTPLELFAGVPWSRYLSIMTRETTYGDQITLNAIANIFDVTLRIISSLGADAMTVIVPRQVSSTGEITLGHYDENNGIHYVVLNRQKADEEKGIHHIVQDVGNDELKSGSELGLRKSEAENESKLNKEDQRYIDFNVEAENQVSKAANVKAPPEYISYFDWLSSEITEMIFLYALSISGFKFPNHVCWTYNNLLQSYDVFKLCTTKANQQLQRIYISHPEMLPKVGKITNTLTVNVQRFAREFSSASGIVKEIKRIIQHPRWNSAWLILQKEAFSWFIILDIFWKAKEN